MIMKVKIKGETKVYDLFESLDAEDFITDLIYKFIEENKPDEVSIVLDDVDLTDPFDDGYRREYHPLL